MQVKQVSNHQKLTAFLISAVCGLFVLVRAFELRVAGISRPFWEDEIHHNFPVLISQNLQELKHNMALQMQPVLDYALRKWVWFPLIGHQELQLRLPALAYGMVTVAVVYVVSQAFFRRHLSAKVASLYAFLPAAWVALNSTEIIYSGEARHYTLVSLLSVTWAFCFVLPDDRREKWLALTSTAFANLHFFSFPLILTGYAFEALRALLKKNYTVFFRLIVTAYCIIHFTKVLNREAFRALSTAPPSGLSCSFSECLSRGISGGLSLWLDFHKYLEYPVPFFVIWGLLVLGLFTSFRRQALKTILLLFGALPASFIYIKFRSDYEFGARYFTPFFGVGAVALVLCFAIVGDRVRSHLKSFSKFFPDRWRNLAFFIGVFVLIFSFQIPQFLSATVRDFSTIEFPPENFSPFYRTYQAVMGQQKPLFLITSHCWAEDIPLIYFKFGPNGEYPFPYSAHNSLACAEAPSDVRKGLDQFLKEYHQESVIVLDQYDQDCSGVPIQGRAQSSIYFRVGAQNRCVWVIRNASSLQDVSEVAKKVGFNAKEGLFDKD